jgi:hypothetical protein
MREGLAARWDRGGHNTIFLSCWPRGMGEADNPERG